MLQDLISVWSWGQHFLIIFFILLFVLYYSGTIFWVKENLPCCKTKRKTICKNLLSEILKCLQKCLWQFEANETSTTTQRNQSNELDQNCNQKSTAQATEEYLTCNRRSILISNLLYSESRSDLCCSLVFLFEFPVHKLSNNGPQACYYDLYFNDLSFVVTWSCRPLSTSHGSAR